MRIHTSQQLLRCQTSTTTSCMHSYSCQRDRLQCCSTNALYRPRRQEAPSPQLGLISIVAPLRWRQHRAQRTSLQPALCVRASDAGRLDSAKLEDAGRPGVSGKGLLLAGAAAALVAAGGWAVWQSGYAVVAKDAVANSVLGRSGFMAALALIFASELGDKTFFIAALLAMRVGRWISFSASVASLTLMTIVSVGIGHAFKHVPDVLKSSLPLGEYLGVALLVYFGLRTLRDAWNMPSEEPEDGGGELDSARDDIDSAEKEGKITAATPWQSFVEVATLIFVAEWGDRSMLATIALGASQSPIGVGAGAVLGHAVATALAVTGGALASRYISEKTVSYTGGFLFLAFAALTVLGVY